MNQIKLFAIVLVCFTLCSCASQPTVRLVVGDDPKWISQDDSMRLAQDLLVRQGYPTAKCITSESTGKDCQFTFETTDSTLRLVIHVDRKSERAKIVQQIHLTQTNSAVLSQPQPPFVIHAGDCLFLRFSANAGTSQGTEQVDAAGYITDPFIGTLLVAGMTPQQVEQAARKHSGVWGPMDVTVYVTPCSATNSPPPFILHPPPRTEFLF